jgi:hypothetical protein
MEGSKAYNVIEDAEVEMNEVNEDNILNNEDIDIDYDAQAYTLLITHNGESIYVITLPDEYISFA